jgi:CheY-like chemotaxis protein
MKMKKNKVLIVDDEQEIRHLLSKMLGEEYIVLEAEDGETALNIARTERPDIILMDLMMPTMDGNTACYELKTDQATRAIPVVMVTAIGLELNERISKDIMGADGYINKPFMRQDILGEIQRLLPKL